MKVIDCVQGSPEWHAARASKVTASRVADALAKGQGKSREAYMGQLIAERLTGCVEEGYRNGHMERGLEVEPAARFAYEEATGTVVHRVGFVLHPRIDNAGASPDGLAGAGLVQLKCPTTHVHIAYLLARKPPAEYIKQMAWECACAELPWCDFVSYDPRMPEHLRLFVARYTPEPELIAQLEDGVRDFLSELDAKVARLSAMAA